MKTTASTPGRNGDPAGCGTCLIILSLVSMMGLYVVGPTLLKIAQGLLEFGQYWGLW